MNWWSILELEPTHDIKEIKKAYSRLSKIYHPEENPERFREIKDAYHHAVSYAKTYRKQNEHHENTEEASPESPASGILINKASNHETPTSKNNTTPPPGQPKSSSSKLNINYKTVKEQSENANEVLKQTFDFDSAIETAAIAQEAYRKKMMDTVKSVYYSNFKKSLAHSWKDLFDSHDFKKLRTDKEFTKDFIKFFSPNDIKPNIWNKVFSPMLKDWEMLWPDIEIQGQFVKLKTPKVINRVTPRYTGSGSGPLGFLFFIFALILILFIIASLLPNNSNSNTNNNYNPYPQVLQDNPNLSTFLSDYYSLKLRLPTHFITEGVYDDSLKSYGLNEAYYNELYQIYSEQGKGAFEERLGKILAEINNTAPSQPDASQETSEPIDENPEALPPETQVSETPVP